MCHIILSAFPLWSFHLRLISRVTLRQILPYPSPHGVPCYASSFRICLLPFPEPSHETTVGLDSPRKTPGRPHSWCGKHPCRVHTGSWGPQGPSDTRRLSSPHGARATAVSPHWLVGETARLPFLVRELPRVLPSRKERR